MGYTFINSASAGSGGNANVTSTTATSMAGADFFVFIVASLPASGTPVPTDSQGNTWTLVGQQTGDTLISVFMAKNAISSASQTFTSTLTAGLMGVVVLGFSGSDLVDPYDSEALNTNGVGSSFNFGIPIAPAELNSVAVLAIAIENAQTVSGVSDDFAGAQTSYVVGENYGCAGLYKIVPTPISLNPTTTFTGSVNFSARLDIFLSAENGSGAAIVLMGDGLT